mgnify:FL=1
MSGIAYQQITEEKNGIKVVLEFPTQSEQTDILRQEIKSVLLCALREKLQKSHNADRELHLSDD